MYTVLFVVEFLKVRMGIRIEEAMKYNLFRFRSIKKRWMSDVFAQSKYIREEFK